MSRLFCPHCGLALFRWKVQKEVTIHKCPNDNCPHRLQDIAKMNPAERELQKRRSSQFKLNYQYREYHFKPEELVHSAPDKLTVVIFSLNIKYIFEKQHRNYLDCLLLEVCFVECH